MYRRGSGQALVLVHGIPLSILTWRNVFDSLSARFTVIAIDLKGFGQSTASAGNGDFSPAAHARTIALVLDRLGIERASLAANSYGCAPVAAFASLYPDRTQRLVLINSVGTGERSHHAERIARMGLASVVARPILSSGVGQRLIKARLRNCYASVPADLKQLADCYHRPLRSRAGAEAFLQCLRQFDEATVASTLSCLTQRTLVGLGCKRPHSSRFGGAPVDGSHAQCNFGNLRTLRTLSP